MTQILAYGLMGTNVRTGSDYSGNKERNPQESGHQAAEEHGRASDEARQPLALSPCELFPDLVYCRRSLRVY